MRPELSIVIPFLNEEAVLPKLRERLSGLEGMPASTEFVLVADGSTDGSCDIIRDWQGEDPRVKLVVLTRNFGHQAAISAGISLAEGHWVGVMDADLQDSPETLLQLLETGKDSNADVVYAIRENRKEGVLKRLSYQLFYRLYNFLADTPVQLDSGDFCIMNRRFVEKLLELPENVRFVRGLRSWVGMRQVGVTVERHMRESGVPQYSLRGLIQLAMDGLTGFSVKPLRLSGMLGFVLCLLGSLLGLVYLSLSLLTDVMDRVPGFLTIILFLLFLHGLNFLLLGIVGEYMAQIFLEVKKRPTFLVDHVESATHSTTTPLPPDHRSTATDTENDG